MKATVTCEKCGYEFGWTYAGGDYGWDLSESYVAASKVHNCGKDAYPQDQPFSTQGAHPIRPMDREAAEWDKAFPPERDLDPTPTIEVPFKVQEFIFEELAPVQAEYLHDLLDKHMDLILEMARDRFRKGYASFGSEMYGWSPERRLDEALQELADAVVYSTSGTLA